MTGKLTAEALARMKVGGRSQVFRCNDAAELESARRNAYYIKKERIRPDGGVYEISTSLKAMTVTVKVVEK